ncbi:hypothetical protein BGZ47_005921 [Haplosporangium gracile]|nr:hypothetical protein BGZ47_005921 [Haplosporangium gracile]
MPTVPRSEPPHLHHPGNIKMQQPVVAPGPEVSADLWVNANSDRDKIGVSVPSIKDVENPLLQYQHNTQEDLEKAIQRVFLVRPVLQDFYASDKIKKKDLELTKWKRAEMDWAIDAPAAAAGHIVVLVDEMLTSTMCLTCVELGVSLHLAKPTMRSCACLTCGRWLHRDIVGAHNLAIVGERWIRSLTRPAPLCRQNSVHLSTSNPSASLSSLVSAPAVQFHLSHLETG